MEGSTKTLIKTKNIARDQMRKNHLFSLSLNQIGYSRAERLLKKSTKGIAGSVLIITPIIESPKLTGGGEALVYFKKDKLKTGTTVTMIVANPPKTTPISSVVSTAFLRELTKFLIT